MFPICQAVSQPVVTLDETERNIREAIEGHLKTLREFGDPIRIRRV